MSDKLDWMNRHLVLLQYPTVKEAVEQEKYPASTDQLELAETFPGSEDFLMQLEKQHEYKDACCFLAYNLHKRAAVWWAYLCVLNLLEELKKNPHKPVDLDDLAKPKPFNIPDWAKMPQIPQPDIENELAEFEKYYQNSMKKYQDSLKNIDPEVKARFDEALGIVQSEIKNVHGKDMFELLHDVCVNTIKSGGKDFVVDLENSPITKATNELKAKIEKVRQDTIKTIKVALPKVDIKAKNKMKLGALDETYKYIVSPDEDNASNCYIIGNKGPDTPEGMLALVAFWSYGDLNPKGENVVKTPSGLMSNGLNSLLLMLALAPGGERKVDERFEVYYRLGYDVAAGRSNWSESVTEQHAPHERLVEELRHQLGEKEPSMRIREPRQAFKETSAAPEVVKKQNISVNRFKFPPKEE